MDRLHEVERYLSDLTEEQYDSLVDRVGKLAGALVAYGVYRILGAPRWVAVGLVTFTGWAQRIDSHLHQLSIDLQARPRVYPPRRRP